MCRTGDGFDDALAESVVGSLKTDLVEEAQWLTRRAARTAIVDGLEMFATRQHLHSAPDVRSPAAFEGTTYPLVASRHRVDETGAT